MEKSTRASILLFNSFHNFFNKRKIVSDLLVSSPGEAGLEASEAARRKSNG